MKLFFEDDFPQEYLADKTKRKAVTLPFEGITARAIMIRRSDGALLGVLHHGRNKYALPGGHVEAGEPPERALLRELEEENIIVYGVDERWRERMAADYYQGYKALNLWYIFVVDDVQLGDNEEALETRWLDQSQDVWYPGMREKICLAIKEFCPDLLRVNVSVLDTW